jgi:cyclic pyranopterin phosphate synthase
VDFRPNQRQGLIEIQARAVTSWRTGVEMEAMVAVSAAALAIYDMAKAIDRAMVIDAVRLVSKEGGRSGDYKRPGEKAWRELRRP